MKKLIVLIMVSMFLLVGCSEEGYSNVEEVNTDSISDYTTLIEGDLYYIKRGNDDMQFPKSYKLFLEGNPNLEIIDIESDPSEGTYNTTRGYFIFTKVLK